MDLLENVMIDYGLKNRVALITGVNNPQGIGAATALAFAREKVKLVLVYKKVPRQFDRNKTGKNGADRYYEANAGDADYVENKLTEMNAEYMIFESDISSEEAVIQIYSEALKRFGKVEVLVNNAAVDDENGFDTIERITQNVIDDTFAVNVRGSIMMIREFVNHRSDYGRIINISTDASQVLLVRLPMGPARRLWKHLLEVLPLKSENMGSLRIALRPDRLRRDGLMRIWKSRSSQ